MTEQRFENKTEHSEKEDEMLRMKAPLMTCKLICVLEACKGRH